MGVTLADFHDVGTILDFRDRLMMCATGRAIILAQSFRRFGGNESGPAALLRLSLRSSFSTKTTETYEKVKMDSLRRGSFL